MALSRRAGVIAVFLALAGSRFAQGQNAVHGAVVDARTRAPVADALVTVRGGIGSVATDQLGRFVVWIPTFPDSISVVRIGYRPLVIRMEMPSDTTITAALVASPVALPEVVVNGTTGSAPGGTAQWRVPEEILRAAPAAIEPDVFRVLEVVPAVSFTSPMSARPIIRGYDAPQSSVLIDGFSVQNPYHLGRIFSAFPAAGAAGITVGTAPQDASVGGALAGTVNIEGRVAEPDSTSFGGTLSLASATAWAGIGGQSIGAFAALRTVHFSVFNAATDGSIPYDFQDGYANLLVTHNGRPRTRITLFGSRDRLFDADEGSGMDWNNLLIGVRSQLYDHGRYHVQGWASVSRFVENATDVPARSSRLDVRDRFTDLSAGAELTIRLASTSIKIGGAARSRQILNRVTPRSGNDLPLAEHDFRRGVVSGYATVSRSIGSASLTAGARVDADPHTAAIQPRARLLIPLGPSSSIGVAMGRTSRLFQMVSDPQSEPDLAFYDFWLPAGEEQTPVPRIDHLAVDGRWATGLLTARASAFASVGRGLMELPPESDQLPRSDMPFRIGTGRTLGLETQVGIARPDQRASASLTYVLSRSERKWRDEWVPWSQDRRHTVRLMAQDRFSSHWSAFGVVEFASGPPLTPVTGVVIVGGPASDGLRHDGPGAHPGYVFGKEGSQRSAGTFRLDLSASYQFGGPGASQMALGFSLINAAFGPVAPMRVAAPGFDFSGDAGQPVGQVRYERLFDAPAVPSVTLSVAF